MMSSVIRGCLPGVVVIAMFGGCAAPVTERKLDIPIESMEARLQNYRLGPGDVVTVMVFQEDDMMSSQRIGQDGTINIPLVGRVAVNGKTVEEAAQVIAARLRDGVLVNPQVTVSIQEYAPRRFTIFGQVNAAGSFEIPSEEYVTLPTAIAMAGGNTRIGNLRSVVVTRTTEEGISEFRVNLLRPEGRQFVVQDRDLITVPESLF